MKLNLLFSSVALTTVAMFGSCCCNDENTVTNGNPTGLYRLEQLSYENGKEALVPSMEQYKYCGPNMTLTLTAQSVRGCDVNIYMKRNEATPLAYTGYNAESKETQVYDSNENQFIERWFNQSSNNHKYYPAESAIVEHYSKNYMQQGVINAIEMLKLNLDYNYNKYIGVWRCKNESNGRVMYKIYSPGFVMLIQNPNTEPGKEGMGLRVCEMNYMPEAEGKILEGFGNGNECDIEWIDDNTFDLTWMAYGHPETETWKRCGLPQAFQECFGTNVPVLE